MWIQSRAVHGGVVVNEDLPRPVQSGSGPRVSSVGEDRAQVIERSFFAGCREMASNSEALNGFRRNGRAVANAIHR